MGLSIRQGAAPASWYVPEWGGNRQSADPIAVLIQPLTAAQAQAALERHMAGQKMGSAKHVLKASRAHRDAVISEQVSEVEGVAIDGGAEVKNGAALVAAIAKAGDASLDALLDEIFEAISSLSRLEEGRRPNS